MKDEGGKKRQFATAVLAMVAIVAFLVHTSAQSPEFPEMDVYVKVGDPYTVLVGYPFTVSGVSTGDSYTVLVGYPFIASNSLYSTLTGYPFLNTGYVVNAGANVTLNGGSSPVALTNGGSLTIAASAGGAGTITGKTWTAQYYRSSGGIAVVTNEAGLVATNLDCFWDYGGTNPASGCQCIGWGSTVGQFYDVANLVITSVNQGATCTATFSSLVKSAMAGSFTQEAVRAYFWILLNGVPLQPTAFAHPDYGTSDDVASPGLGEIFLRPHLFMRQMALTVRATPPTGTNVWNLQMAVVPSNDLPVAVVQEVWGQYTNVPRLDVTEFGN